MWERLVNFLIDGVVICVTWVLGLLPDSPFTFEPIEWGNFGKLVGVVLPVSDMATHFTLILSACLLYYAVRWILRIIKMIQ